MTQLACQTQVEHIDAGELPRYFVVSGVALAADVTALYLLSQWFGAHYLIANPIAFILGAVVAYLGSVHWAFRSRRLQNAGLEFAIFAAIGVAGLVVNEAVLWLGIEVAALSLLLAKFGAAGASFAFNFVVRKLLLFS
ncbi:MAG: GtrA family protein [Alphaproteobacteria bacterium]|nr:GtrA family protein [Alphaproteobacteria bacterium]MDP6563318.1 GtrA family protein [Alphaproteobacteria bacterium]MDP6816122.1 GtrA family protein [Alphaproteobacteria bacterium]